MNRSTEGSTEIRVSLHATVAEIVQSLSKKLQLEEKYVQLSMEQVFLGQSEIKVLKSTSKRSVRKMWPVDAQRRNLFYEV